MIADKGQMNDDTLVLIDGSSYLFRAYHAMTGMTRADGRPTGAIFGFINSLDLIEKTVNSTRLVVVFDRPEPTFRTEIDAGYKANREECPVDLQEQIPIVKELLDAMGIPRFEQSGFEADDIIGTLACWWEREQRGEIVIASGDKDMLQLVTDRTTVLRTHQNHTKLYNAAAVVEKYQVPPDRFVDVLALMGDSVDNIPGVPGIGEKTAGGLIAEYGSLDELYRQIERIKAAKRRESLIEHRETAYRARALATIRTDVPVELTVERVSRGEPDATRLYQLFSDLEMRTRAAYWRDRAGVEEAPKRYELVNSLERLREILETLDSELILAFDTETNSLDTGRAELVGFSFSQKASVAYYVPVGHGTNQDLNEAAALDTMRSWFENPHRRKVAHNLKFDAHVLNRAGVQVVNADDTMVMSQLVDPDAASHGLKDLAGRLLQFPMATYQDIAGTGSAQMTFDRLNAENVYEYAAADADATIRLYAYYQPRLAERGVSELYETIERPLIDVLRRMESHGVLVDPQVLATQSAELAEEMAEIERSVYKEAGREFNLNSPAQLAVVLFDEMGIKPPGRNRSTKAEVLEKLAEDGVSICRAIVEYRQRAKLKSTYLDALTSLISLVDGRVHTTYHQASANTGRISSSDPNLQNIPVRTEMGKRVRRAFIAPEGSRLLSADYSQIELRILGWMAEDPGLLGAFRDGEDIHTRTASEIFGVSPDRVDDAMRSKAKAVNFGLNYGMTAHGLAERLGIDRTTAQRYIDAFFTQFPRVREFLDRIVEEGRKEGFIRTMMGRRVPTRGLDDPNRLRREAARRAAINAPIQGSAADLLKRAMVRVDEWIRRENPPVRMILTVHDELIFEVREGSEQEAAGAIRRIMENAAELSVPTPVNISLGVNWAEL